MDFMLCLQELLPGEIACYLLVSKGILCMGKRP